MQIKRREYGWLWLGAIALGITAGVSTSFGDDAKGWHGDHEKGRGAGGFMLGVCVGQTMGKAGVFLPEPPADMKPGQDPHASWPDATKSAFKSAMDTCKTKMQTWMKNHPWGGKGPKGDAPGGGAGAGAGTPAEGT